MNLSNYFSIKLIHWSINIFHLGNLPRRKLKISLNLGSRVEYENSMKRRDKIYKKYIKTSQLDIKQEYELQYKTLKNQIVKLCRDSKSTYFQSFFRSNASNIKNTWEMRQQNN